MLKDLTRNGSAPDYLRLDAGKPQARLSLARRISAAGWSQKDAGQESVMRRRRSALAITLTDDSAIGAAAMTGLRSKPKAG